MSDSWWPLWANWFHNLYLGPFAPFVFVTFLPFTLWFYLPFWPALYSGNFPLLYFWRPSEEEGWSLDAQLPPSSSQLWRRLCLPAASPFGPSDPSLRNDFSGFPESLSLCFELYPGSSKLFLEHFSKWIQRSALSPMWIFFWENTFCLKVKWWVLLCSTPQPCLPYFKR